MDHIGQDRSLETILAELQSIKPPTESVSMNHIVRLEGQLQEARNMSMQRVESLSERLDELRAVVEDKSKSIDVTGKGFEILVNRTKELTESIDQLTVGRDSLHQTTAELQWHVGHTNSSIEEIRKEISQAAKDFAVLRQEVQEMRSAQRRADEQAKQIEDLKNTQATMAAQIAQMQTILAAQGSGNAARVPVRASVTPAVASMGELRGPITSSVAMSPAVQVTVAAPQIATSQADMARQQKRKLEDEELQRLRDQRHQQLLQKHQQQQQQQQPVSAPVQQQVQQQAPPSFVSNISSEHLEKIREFRRQLESESVQNNTRLEAMKTAELGNFLKEKLRAQQAASRKLRTPVSSAGTTQQTRNEVQYSSPATGSESKCLPARRPESPRHASNNSPLSEVVNPHAVLSPSSFANMQLSPTPQTAISVSTTSAQRPVQSTQAKPAPQLQKKSVSPANPVAAPVLSQRPKAARPADNHSPSPISKRLSTHSPKSISSSDWDGSSRPRSTASPIEPGEIGHMSIKGASNKQNPRAVLATSSSKAQPSESLSIKGRSRLAKQQHGSSDSEIEFPDAKRGFHSPRLAAYSGGAGTDDSEDDSDDLISRPKAPSGSIAQAPSQLGIVGASSISNRAGGSFRGDLASRLGTKHSRWSENSDQTPPSTHDSDARLSDSRYDSRRRERSPTSRRRRSQSPVGRSLSCRSEPTGLEMKDQMGNEITAERISTVLGPFFCIGYSAIGPMYKAFYGCQLLAMGVQASDLHSHLTHLEGLRYFKTASGQGFSRHSIVRYVARSGTAASQMERRLRRNLLDPEAVPEPLLYYHMLTLCCCRLSDTNGSVVQDVLRELTNKRLDDLRTITADGIVCMRADEVWARTADWASMLVQFIRSHNAQRVLACADRCYETYVNQCEKANVSQGGILDPQGSVANNMLKMNMDHSKLFLGIKSTDLKQLYRYLHFIMSARLTGDTARDDIIFLESLAKSYIDIA
ncbi:hypothetical protein EC988_001339 [Linderina pennispora]|nr:hypothetical protein EC988_001339 [Linderina pennispora]